MIYTIDKFEAYDPSVGPSIFLEDIVGTAIGVDQWNRGYVGSVYDYTIYTTNPFTGEIVPIASFNQCIDELTFDSNGDLYVLECSETDPSTIIKLIPPRVEIDGCDTGVLNWDVEDDLTLTDRIEECAQALNHGDFVSCVAMTMNAFMQSGKMTPQEMSSIISCAAQSQIP